MVRFSLGDKVRITVENGDGSVSEGEVVELVCLGCIKVSAKGEAREFLYFPEVVSWRELFPGNEGLEFNPDAPTFLIEKVAVAIEG